MKSKKWNIFVLLTTCLVLVGLALPTIIIDPYFHYHKPLNNMMYILNNERYQNDGITRNFEYDAVITGTSMTENFKTSELDRLFNTHSIKIPFAGAYYKEVDDAIERALNRKRNIKYVFRGLDVNYIAADKDACSYDNYPTYLYNKKIFDDVNYFWNKEILMNDVLTIDRSVEKGMHITSFDKYMNWNSEYLFGKKNVLEVYRRPEISKAKESLTKKEKEIIYDNINQNVLQTAKENKEVTFYYFIPPYSIVYWDEMHRRGEIERAIECQKLVIEQILECENIKLYSFFDNFELIENLDNYKDPYHYGEKINSQILQWMKEEQGELTVENYNIYLDSILEHYLNYDYDRIFSEKEF